ncbi:hypothetical protein FHS21_001290 [Phyllobacterium trifolii]|uniref:Uncharacterized protein n=1 Tax=Phyllobacterium trifolii TaxID=300193 RepID=A0A839U9H0_9HYPH|nr:hypothetical protein [Phyllobacterium trifolii]MBB3144889.1 hypothetical protein [Phyllobacterium trifolii]
MNRTFEQEPDRILIVDPLTDNRARRESWKLMAAIAFMGLAFVAGCLGSVL